MRVFTRLVQFSNNANSNLLARKNLVPLAAAGGGLNSCTFHWQSSGYLRASAHTEKAVQSDSPTKSAAKVDNSKVVIMHIVPRGRTLPSPSPYVMKLWTYLQMTDIPFKVSTKTPFGPQGKSPWVTVDGQDIADSQVIVEKLGKKFGKDLGKAYTAEQLAVARAVRVLLEERTIWCAVGWRTGEGMLDAKDKVFKLSSSPLIQFYFRYIFLARVRRDAKAQGIGRHTKEQIIQFGLDDMRAVSKILGKKKYILGDTPCEDDCGIFGILAQGYWGLPNSPYHRIMEDELTNLKDYCERMKSTFWKDNWEKNLAR